MAAAKTKIEILIFHRSACTLHSPGRCVSSQKGPLYEARVGIATLKEPVTQNRRGETGQPLVNFKQNNFE